MRIRRIDAKDAEGVYRIWQKSQSSSAYPLAGGGWSPEKLKSRLDGNDLGLGALNEEDQLIGFVIYRAQNGVNEVILLATDPAQRRQGVMRHLMGHLQGQIPAGQELWLEVHEENQGAIGFYKALGFSVDGIRNHYYGPDQGAVLMSFKAVLKRQ